MDLYTVDRATDKLNLESQNEIHNKIESGIIALPFYFILKQKCVRVRIKQVAYSSRIKPVRETSLLQAYSRLKLTVEIA